MRGHHDLADRGLLHPLHQFQKFKLARRRQRRFRLVEDEDALAFATVFEELQKALAMRVREIVRRNTWRHAGDHFGIDLVLVSRDREKTLGAEEPAVVDLRQPAGAKRLRQFAPIASSASE